MAPDAVASLLVTRLPVWANDIVLKSSHSIARYTSGFLVLDEKFQMILSLRLSLSQADALDSLLRSTSVLAASVRYCKLLLVCSTSAVT